MANDARPDEELEYSDDVVVELDNICGGFRVQCVAHEEYLMDADASVIRVADQPFAGTSSEIARETASAFLDRPFAERKRIVCFTDTESLQSLVPVGLQSLGVETLRTQDISAQWCRCVRTVRHQCRSVSRTRLAIIASQSL